MPLSDFEQLQLRELEAQLARERQLVRLARRHGAASGDAWVRITAVLAGVGGSLGLSLAIAGAVSHASELGAAGVVVLTATAVLAGVALIVIGVSSYRRDRRLDQLRQPQSLGR